MATLSIVLRALDRGTAGFVPRTLLELGAGDGSMMLRLARRRARRWPDVRVTLLDRLQVVAPSHRRRPDPSSAGRRASWRWMCSTGWQVPTTRAGMSSSPTCSCITFRQSELQRLLARHCGACSRVPVLRAQAFRGGTRGKPPGRPGRGRACNPTGCGVERARGISGTRVVEPLARSAGLGHRRVSGRPVQPLSARRPEGAIDARRLRCRRCRRWPVGRYGRHAPRAGRMAGCRRRESAVPPPQSVRGVHFGNDLAALAATGHCRSAAEARRTTGTPCRRLRRQRDGDGRAGVGRWAGRRAAAEPWAANTSIPLLLQRAAQAGATVWQPCALSQFVERGSGYECTIVDKGTRRFRVLRSRLIIAAHGSWESGPMPTQQLAPAAARLGSVRFQGPLQGQHAATGSDAVARLSGWLWRHGAHGWWSCQPVVLHSPRRAGTLPAPIA